MGKYVCDGLEIIDATSGKLDVRAPMGVGGAIKKKNLSPIYP
jgi:hypothetical protein